MRQHDKSSCILDRNSNRYFQSDLYTFCRLKSRSKGESKCGLKIDEIEFVFKLSRFKWQTSSVGEQTTEIAFELSKRSEEIELP
jgi:hypothetical protein